MRDMVVVRMARQCRYVDYTLLYIVKRPATSSPQTWRHGLCAEPQGRWHGATGGSAGFSQTKAMPANGLFQDDADIDLHLFLYICNVKQTNDNNLP
jgi:hypothetical protein